jgi:hypothetical protein
LRDARDLDLDYYPWLGWSFDEVERLAADSRLANREQYLGLT